MNSFPFSLIAREYRYRRLVELNSIPERVGDRCARVEDRRRVCLAHRPYLGPQERSGGSIYEKSGLLRAS